MSDVILQGLLGKDKFIPKSYQWDEEGSRLYEKNSYENKFYYIHRSEKSLLEKYIKDIISTVPLPCDYVTLGCGEMKKDRILIDALLTRQQTLNLYPVDISVDMVMKASEEIAKEYGKQLRVVPIPGDYYAGIEAIRNNKNNRKLIGFIGGSLQNIVYEGQIELLRNIGTAMTHQDLLIVTFDTTEDEETIFKAYFGEDGRSGFTETYRNYFCRLNRDFGLTIDPDTFVYGATYTKSVHKDRPSRLLMSATSKIDQSHVIPSTGVTLRFRLGEKVFLNDCESSSYKYTAEQVEALCTKADLQLVRTWRSDDGHVSSFAMKRI